MSATPRRTAALLGALAVLLVASCGGDPRSNPPSATATTPAPSAASTTPPPTPTPTPDDAPVPFPADVAADEQGASLDAALTVTDVTTGQHEGYDRVVFRLGGTGTPGWMVRYVDQAIDDPADTVLDIAGDGTLAVVLLGVQLPDTTGVPEWDGTNPIRTPDYAVLREVNVRGQFEGQELAYLGLDSGDHPFRVFALADPARVVVDVRHDG